MKKLFNDKTSHCWENGDFLKAIVCGDLKIPLYTTILSVCVCVCVCVCVWGRERERVPQNTLLFEFFKVTKKLTIQVLKLS